MRRIAISLGMAAMMAAILAGTAAPAYAAITYSMLKEQGYRTSKFSRKPQAVPGDFRLGWFVSKGEDRYFCDLRRATVRKGNALFTIATGQPLPLDMKMAKAMGYAPSDFPNYRDLAAGRLEPADVGKCWRLR